MHRPHVHWPVALCLLANLLVTHVGDGLAVQIEPNPNPDGNTITITPSTPRENLVPFTNVGTINIQPSASLSNANRFENSGAVFSAGTITNSDAFINNRVFALQEGSQFNNLASGRYSGGLGSIGIAGTFVNEGAVTHSLGHIIVGETGQYIQRQAVGSFVTPTTVTPDAPFTNAGRVHIVAGDFTIDPISVRAASATYDQSSTGTTQIDAKLQNTGGHVSNAGMIRIGATGEYRQESPLSPFMAGSTTNTGTFTNAGMTNIYTGIFENRGGFTHVGSVHIGEHASFTNTSSGVYHPFPGGTTRIDGTFVNNFAVQNGGAITVSVTGVYSQVAGLSPIGTGTGQGGTFTNAGRVYIGEGTEFRSGVLADRPTSSGQYMQQASGTTLIDGSFDTRGYVTNEGAMTVGATGQYLQSRGDSTGLPAVSTSNTGTFTNAGMVRIGEGTSFSNFPRLEHGSPPPVGGHYIQQSGGTTQIDGSFSSFGGRVTNEGAITVGATGTYGQTRSGAGVGATPATVNTGTFTNAGNTLVNAGTFTNQGSVVNSGTFQVAVNGVATLINHGTVVNSGTFEVGAGVGAVGGVSGTGTYLQNAVAAETIVNGTFAHNISLQAGALTGTGTIQGAVQNSGGLILPGNNGLGTLTIKGQYAQGFGGTLGINLAGLNSHGLLAVHGTGTAVALNGFLTIRLLNGFSPSLGNTFGVLTCTGCAMSGTLLGLSLPALASGLDWSVRVVDALGTLQLAVVSGPATSAPEPATLLLVGIGFVALVGWRRRQARARSALTVVS
ncbi:MAG: PEP-CTERM sorting domain-containing protein [Nitrospira sp.]|nr:PEP-CTERM sorting domain-containing protein [Nitrospira sp.]